MKVDQVCEIATASGRGVRGVVKLEDDRFSLAEQISPDQPAGLLVAPFAFERGVLFAQNLLAGHPDAINHEKAGLIVSVTLMALLSQFHQSLPDQSPACEPGPTAGADAAASAPASFVGSGLSEGRRQRV
ncbi:hypothetical protein PUV47_01915 [Pseudovibrio exalbescens]|uniref:hypothetical protein n=1 Tax=Pseudovibrio exalbescens TaxID=197461 RepID=UPI002365BCF6|nr:hypothetical protein [Pseudovibrio exalbescens]MDD7908660.1 hypothetical protein [Pseudovibrio exalbescens]